MGARRDLLNLNDRRRSAGDFPLREVFSVPSGSRLTNLEGFEPPGVALRYFLIHEWARAAGRSVCVALVTKPEMVDSERANPRKIGTIIATEIEFTDDIFTTEEDALRWLERLEWDLSAR